MNGAVKTGHKQTGWEIYELLRTMYNFFKYSPASRALYTAITGRTKFPPKFTSIRWLENGHWIDRTFNVYDNVVRKFVTNSSTIKKKLNAERSFAQSPTGSCKVDHGRSRFQGEKPLAPFLYTAIVEFREP